ncbi:hypothetical protein SIAM614_01229 [Stappia aggregata IAM 12614]|uniref:Uncharacterized protein n=1 Tax=Roseibium aggregatum (strain ATCC 25650 / DSM 13394 / JCM 20685 / NBRC 16684 / NCIMB 2208 / IAM 12614 / B1) TaxID=384765 RepID=A0P0Q6_ROSAI|nr:hypothetical protein SIAM614_01229 [Stappia aggregata IAM 12614] [Roseibium aggregatum IAM 12614]
MKDEYILLFIIIVLLFFLISTVFFSAMLLISIGDVSIFSLDLFQANRCEVSAGEKY